MITSKRGMYNSKMRIVPSIGPGELSPFVSHANFFDVGMATSWGPRRLHDIELILVVSGALQYERNSCTVEVPAGDVVMVSPDVMHTITVKPHQGRTVISCIHFEPIAGQDYREGGYVLDPILPEIVCTEGHYEVRDLFMRCARIADGYARYRAERLSAVFHELWILLCEIAGGRGEESMGRRMREMLSFVRRNLTGKMDRTRLGKQFDVTPQYINSLFKKELGITPTEFIHRERVQLGYRLMMEEGLSVKQAAARVGFNDQFYFSRIFKRVMNFSPSEST